MADGITRFFAELERREYEPLLDKAAGTLRLDLCEGERTTYWLLTIDRGRIRVSQEKRPADATVRTSRSFFEQIVAGRENLIAAWARGEVSTTGDPRLALRMERIFPGPPDARGPRRVNARGPRRMLVKEAR